MLLLVLLSICALFECNSTSFAKRKANFALQLRKRKWRRKCDRFLFDVEFDSFFLSCGLETQSIDPVFPI